LERHEAFLRQVLQGQGVNNLQRHYNSHPRIHILLKKQAVKHPSNKQRLLKDDTQAKTLAQNRLIYIAQAAIELRESNPD
jgi:hypothetical protein